MGSQGEGTYQIVGVDSSPYTTKLRAIFRYRRIPFVWHCAFPQFDPRFQTYQPKLMPLVIDPEGRGLQDSTAVALDLAQRFPARSISPSDPVLNLCSLIIEDMADELVGKLLYRQRFGADLSRRFGTRWVMDDTFAALGEADLTSRAETFLDRQLERRELVGVTSGNIKVFDRIFDRLVSAYGAIMGRDRYLFGSRPSLGDFGLLAQFYTLCADPSPMAIIREQAPRIEFAARRAHDLSGVEGDWQTGDTLTGPVQDLMRLAGDTYLPILAANARAVEQGDSSFDVDLPSGTLRLTPFRYHAKCLQSLRQAFSDLSVEDRARAADTLGPTGGLAFLT